MLVQLCNPGLVHLWTRSRGSYQVCPSLTSSAGLLRSNAIGSGGKSSERNQGQNGPEKHKLSKDPSMCQGGLTALRPMTSQCAPQRPFSPRPRGGQNPIHEGVQANTASWLRQLPAKSKGHCPPQGPRGVFVVFPSPPRYSA